MTDHFKFDFDKKIYPTSVCKVCKIYKAGNLYNQKVFTDSPSIKPQLLNLQ